jgi:hypothetical protein
MISLKNMVGLLNYETSEEIKQVLNEARGKTISSIEILDTDPDYETFLKIEFTDHSIMIITDEGQSCCESRFMTTDDNLNDFIGAVLLNIESKPGGDTEDENGDWQDIEFLEITTNNGFFQIVNHNEHNGFYGGFCMSAKWVTL